MRPGMINGKVRLAARPLLMTQAAYSTVCKWKPGGKIKSSTKCDEKGGQCALLFCLECWSTPALLPGAELFLRVFCLTSTSHPSIAQWISESSWTLWTASPPLLAVPVSGTSDSGAAVFVFDVSDPARKSDGWCRANMDWNVALTRSRIDGFMTSISRSSPFTMRIKSWQFHDFMIYSHHIPR